MRKSDETHGQYAQRLFLEGYNCAQAVFCAYAEELGIDRFTAARLVSPLGGGVGRLREICGTVSGAMLVIGQRYGYGTPETGAPKARLYAIEQEFAKRFAAVNGSYICRELLGLGKATGASAPTPEARTDAYYQKRPCPALCKCSADILDGLFADLSSGALAL